MTKAELINQLANATNATLKQAEISFNATIEVLTQTLVAGETLTIPGFGTFGVKTRAARQGMNPATKKPISIPETQVAYFKVGSKLKEAVANAKSAGSAKTKAVNKKDATAQTKPAAKKTVGKEKK